MKAGTPASVPPAFVSYIAAHERQPTPTAPASREAASSQSASRRGSGGWTIYGETTSGSNVRSRQGFPDPHPNQAGCYAAAPTRAVGGFSMAYGWLLPVAVLVDSILIASAIATPALLALRED